MKAIISGQAGAAVLIDEANISAVRYDSPERTPCTRGEIPYLLADATDVLEIDVATPDEAMAALNLAWHQDRCLHLILILLDGEADDEARRLAAESLEDLLAEPKVVEFVFDRLHATPLPTQSNLVGALLLAESARAQRLLGFLEKLGTDQPEITHLRQRWDLLPPELFGNPAAKQQFGRVAVLAGAFRRLAQAEPALRNNVLVSCLSDPNFRRLPNFQQILLAWAEPVRITPDLPALELEGEHDGAAGSREHDGSRWARRSASIFDNITRQKEAIRRLISEGDLRRCRRFIDDLVRYQGERSTSSELAMSLCDLAMHAKKVGAHGFQLELARRAVDILPTDGWALAQLGDACLRLGQYPEALASYETAAQFGQEEVARNGRAEVLKAQGQFPEALEEYERTIQAFPENVFARNGRAEVLKAQGRLPEALEEYERTIQAFPSDVFARTGRAEVLKAQGRLPEALEEYERTIQAFPSDVVARSGRAEVLKAQGRLPEALEEYERTIQASPSDVVARNGRAEVLKAQGRLPEALEEYERTIQASPSDVVARNGRAEVLKAQGRLPEALEEYERTIQAFPSDVFARTGRAEVLKAQGRLPEALKEYERTIQAFPENVVARSGRAEVLKAQGRLPEALEEYKRAIQAFLSDVFARSGRAEVLKAQARLPEALEEYERTIQAFPENVVARSGRAEVLKAQGRLPEALEEYDRIMQQFPYDLVASTGKAAIFVILGRYEQALDLLPVGLPATRDDWIGFHIRGMIHLKKGDVSDAIQLFERGVRECPWHTQTYYFRTALGAARLRQEEYREAIEAIQHDETPVCEVLRIHAFGAIGDRPRAKTALQRVEAHQMPVVIELREELARRYSLREPGVPRHSEEWITDRECDLLLAA